MHYFVSFLIVGTITLGYGILTIAYHLYLMLLHDKDLAFSLKAHEYYILACGVMIIIGIIALIIKQGETLLAGLISCGCIGLLLLFIDAKGEASSWIEVNPVGMLIFGIDFPFFIYLLTFARKHNWLISLGITTKQWESIKKFKALYKKYNREIIPLSEADKFINIEEQLTWKQWFLNFKDFFTRSIRKSEILQ